MTLSARPAGSTLRPSGSGVLLADAAYSSAHTGSLLKALSLPASAPETPTCQVVSAAFCWAGQYLSPLDDLSQEMASDVVTGGPRQSQPPSSPLAFLPLPPLNPPLYHHCPGLSMLSHLFTASRHTDGPSPASLIAFALGQISLVHKSWLTMAMFHRTKLGTQWAWLPCMDPGLP